MELEIEVGTADEMQLISKELESFASGIALSRADFSVAKIVVAKDFDAAVNRIQGTSNYRGTRPGKSITATAKYFESGGNVTIVMSSLLYTSKNDTLTRFAVFFHEICHVINARRLPERPLSWTAKSIYLRNLYALYDEYLADMMAFAAIEELFPEKTSVWQESIAETLDGFAETVSSPECYERMQKEIWSFRTRAVQLTGFLEAITVVLDIVGLSIAHLYAAMDSYPEQGKKIDLTRSKFINFRTERLVNLYREMYKEEIYDLSAHIEEMVGFMENFGVRFEDTATGVYCHVLDA